MAGRKEMATLRMEKNKLEMSDVEPFSMAPLLKSQTSESNATAAPCAANSKPRSS